MQEQLITSLNVFLETYPPTYSEINKDLEPRPAQASTTTARLAVATPAGRPSTINWANGALKYTRLQEKEGDLKDTSPEYGIADAYLAFRHAVSQDEGFQALVGRLQAEKPRNEASSRSDYEHNVFTPFINHLRYNPRAAELWNITKFENILRRSGIDLTVKLEVVHECHLKTKDAVGSGEGGVRVDTMTFFSIKHSDSPAQINTRQVGKPYHTRARAREEAERLAAESQRAECLHGLSTELQTQLIKDPVANKPAYLGFNQTWFHFFTNKDRDAGDLVLEYIQKLWTMIKGTRTENSDAKKLRAIITQRRGLTPIEYKKPYLIKKSRVQAIASAKISLSGLNPPSGDEVLASLQQGLRYGFAVGSRTILFVDYTSTSLLRLPAALVKVLGEVYKKGWSAPDETRWDQAGYEVWWRHSENKTTGRADPKLDELPPAMTLAFGLWLAIQDAVESAESFLGNIEEEDPKK